MAQQRLRLEAADCHAGLRLDQFLARLLPAGTGSNVSRREARRLIAVGAVYVEGRRVHIQSLKLRPGAQVEVYWDAGPREQPAPAEAELGGRILYEDADLIAVDKPSGINVQGTPADDVHDLLSELRRNLARRDGKPPYLALHHRLDRGTSGVLLLARSRRVNTGLAAAFKERRVDKRYLALARTAETPQAQRFAVRDRLAWRRAGDEGRRRAVSVEAGGRPAETEFRVLEALADAVLVEAVPTTGRTHQIRVHLANAGLAVLGDRLYGPRGSRDRAPRLMLHAAALALEHPVSGAPLRIESPLPEDFLGLLEALGGSGESAQA